MRKETTNAIYWSSILLPCMYLCYWRVYHNELSVSKSDVKREHTHTHILL